MKKENYSMEDKKALNSEDLEKVTGGLNDDLYSGFYCDKCRRSYNINDLIDTYICPNCGAELHGINHTDTGDDSPDWGWELDV